MTEPPKSFVRCYRIAHSGSTNAISCVFSQSLQSQEWHGRGFGKKSEERRRPDSDGVRCIATSVDENGKWRSSLLCKVGSKAPQLRIRQAWRDFVKSNGAAVRKNADMGVYLIVGISTEWIKEAGDLHDVKNPRIKALFKHGTAWCESVLGRPFAIRFDVDEDGGGALDIFCAPI